MKEKVKALERHNFHNHGFKNRRFHLKPTQDVLFVPFFLLSVNP